MATLNLNRTKITMILIALMAGLMTYLNWDRIRCAVFKKCTCEQIWRMPKPSCRIDSLEFQKTVFGLEGKKEVKFFAKYLCNELITDTTHDNYKETKLWLESNCYRIKKDDTCKCGSKFLLWESPPGQPVDVGVVVGGGTTPGKPAGVMLNFIIDIGKLSSEIATLEPNNDRPKCNPGHKNIRLAIIDSGVDTVLNPSQNVLRWVGSDFNTYHQAQCNYPLSDFGVNISNNLSPASLPDDYLGHGTAVNGVVSGMSSDNYYKDLNLEICNINIFNKNSGTCTLMDALCAVEYAINQNADVVNMSWGFALGRSVSGDSKFDSIIKSIVESTKTAFYDIISNKGNQVLFIAAIGNDSASLDTNYTFLPGALAGNISNLISVGSIDSSGNRSLFSNYDMSNQAQVSIYTIGENIIMPKCGQNRQTSSTPPTASQFFIISSGTSYAAPLVTRYAVAMINSGISPSSIKSKLLNQNSTNVYLNNENFTILVLDKQKIESGLCKDFF